MRDLAGKVAFVTGGASGIGYGMARAFLNAGMKVVIADLMQSHLQEVAAQHQGTNSLHLMQLDVSDREAMAKAADETERVFGKVHVLCNNVGVSQRNPIDEASYEDWDYVLNVNLGGTINGLVNFLPRIKKHGEGGHIVTTSSMAGMIPVPAFAGVYATSKFALRGMMDALRLALGPHRIGVSVLCPGHVHSRAMSAGDQYRAAHETGTGMSEAQRFHEGGMDPFMVGERVLEAIRENELYIFTHAEFKEEVSGYFQRMLDAFPEDDTSDPIRRARDQQRAAMTEEARLLADRIDD